MKINWLVCNLWKATDGQIGDAERRNIRVFVAHFASPPQGILLTETASISPVISNCTEEFVLEKEIYEIIIYCKGIF